jgi:hypothetical protein
MSHYAPTGTPTVGLRLRSHGVAWLIGLLLLVAVAATATIVVAGGGGSRGPAAPSVSRPAGGPNETLRGISAGTSAGANGARPAGGPNETLRGQVLAPPRGPRPQH